MQVTTQNAAGTNHSAINWQSFSIPTGSSTYFQQPSATSTSINRVVTNTPTQIFGTLSSNGNLVLVNHAGIAVGTGAVVDTNGFTASTLAMSDADAMAGRLRFGDGQIGVAGLSVNGGILARNGDVVLLGSNISTGTQALVQAPNGSTVLAAGQQVEITGRGLEGIRLQVQAPTDSAVNLGSLGGNAVGIFAGTLKHSGSIQATTATLEGGRVVLKAAGDAIIEGNGSIVATGVTGGSVDVLGTRVGLIDNASIDASGQFGGGSIRVGGDFQGKNPDIQNASMTVLGAQTSLKADALQSGDGGRVIVWADDATRYLGAISAQGGAQSGNGGAVEVSGKGFLSFNGTVTTDAANGEKGSLLLDPTNVFIAVDQATATALGMSGTDISLDLSGPTLFSTLGVPTDSLLTTAVLSSALVSNNVTVSTSSSGGGAGNIVVGSSVTKNAGAGTTLTLSANNNIVLNNGISIASTSTASPLSVVMTAPGSLTMNTGSSIDSKGGNITLQSVGGMNLSGGLTATGGTIDLQFGAGGLSQTTGSIAASTLSITGDSYATLTGSNTVTTFNATKTGSNTNQFTYWNTGALTLGSISQAGDLTIKADTGDITQSGTISKTGYGSPIFSFNAVSGNIDLTSSNSVGGTSINLAGGAIAFHSSGSLDVTNLTRNGNHGLDLQANGGALTLPSAAINTGTEDLTLYSYGGLSIGGTLAGKNISLETGNSGALTLADSVTATGDLVIDVYGALSLSTGSISSGGSTFIAASGNLNVPSLNLTYANNKDLTLIADGGNLTLPTGAISIGTGTLTLESNGALATAGNLTAQNISLKSGDTLTIGHVVNATSGTLRLEGESGISQPYGTGATNYLHANSLEAIAGYGSISLLNPNNQVGTLAAYASGGIDFHGSSNLTIGHVGETNGLYSDGGAINVVNTGSINIDGDIRSYGYGYGISLTSSGAITHTDSTENVIETYDGNITLSGTSIGAAGGQSEYSGGTGQVLALGAGSIPGYGNAVLVYPGSGDVIATASSGNIHLFGVNDLNVGAISASSGSVHLTAAGSLTLNGNITAGASGDSIVLDVSSYGYSYDSITTNGNSLTTPGRWLMYANGYGGTVYLGYGQTASFKQYNSANGDTVLGSGNGIVYYDAPGFGGVLTGTASKVYDGSTTIDLAGTSVSGHPTSTGSDDLSSAVFAGGSGYMADANVGSGKLVDADWLKFTGVVAPEGSGYGMTVYYVMPGVSGSVGTVTPARAIATISGAGTRVYDGTNIVNASIFTLSGLVDGETLTFTGAGTVADKNVGANKAVSLGSLALGDGTGLASNYTLDGGVFTASITPLAITGYSGLGVDNKPYDGKTTAMVNTTNALVSGLLSGDVVNLSAGSATANFDTKNVGTAKTVTISGLTLSGTDAINYSMTTAQGATTASGNITPLALTAVSGITTSKVYDGTTEGKNVSLSGAQLAGLIAGDTVTLGGTADVVYSDRNVGSNTLSLGSFSGLTLTGADAGNYTLGSSLTGTGSGTITQRPLATWSGAAGNGLWSDKGNWDALPDGTNVAAVTGLAGVTVIYDIGVRTVLNALTTGNFTMTTGDLVLGGALTVNGGYNQTGGKVTASGPVSITTTGNLLVGTLTASNVTLTSGGNITQGGPLNIDTKLTTSSVTGTTLTNGENHVKAYQGGNSGAGNIQFNTVGAVVLDGLNTANGNVTVVNYGGIDSVGAIVANGSVSLTANSPLTISGPITATGNIALAATNQTSEGNIVINGAVKSSGGSVAVAAASNYVQNGSIQAAQGVSASAGGSMSFGPDAITTGNPVNFEAGGTVVVPPGAAPTTGSTPTDFVATFLNKFQDSVTAQNTSTDPADKKKEKDVVVEGQTCAR